MEWENRRGKLRGTQQRISLQLGADIQPPTLPLLLQTSTACSECLMRMKTQHFFDSIYNASHQLRPNCAAYTSSFFMLLVFFFVLHPSLFAHQTAGGDHMFTESGPAIMIERTRTLSFCRHTSPYIYHINSLLRVYFPHLLRSFRQRCDKTLTGKSLLKNVHSSLQTRLVSTFERVVTSDL